MTLLWMTKKSTVIQARDLDYADDNSLSRWASITWFSRGLRAMHQEEEKNKADRRGGGERDSFVKQE